MGVQIKMNNPLEIFTAAGVPYGQIVLLSEMVTGGASVTVSFYEVAIAYNGKTVKVKLPCITSALLKNTALPAQKDVSREALSKLITMAKKHLMHDTVVGTTASGPLGDPIGESIDEFIHKDIEKTLAAKLASEKPKTKISDGSTNQGQTLGELLKKKLDAVAESAPDAVIDEVSPGPNGAVRLRDATKLLQPVKGTDASSVYYTIALSDKIKVAARVKDGGAKGVSIRVEGALVAPIKQRLTEMGMKTGKDYMSIHMAVSSDFDVAKVIGAVLMAMDVDFKDRVTPTQLKLVKGK